MAHVTSLTRVGRRADGAGDGNPGCQWPSSCSLMRPRNIWNTHRHARDYLPAVIFHLWRPPVATSYAHAAAPAFSERSCARPVRRARAAAARINPNRGGAAERRASNAPDIEITLDAHPTA
jgi:hypothetical protein